MNCKKTLYKELRDLVKNHINKEIILVCVGTDRSTGDSLGPLVGHFLLGKNLKHIKTYGSIEEPVHAVNLEEKIETINKNHPNSFIIGVDACLGKLKSVGKISINNTPLKPGAGVNKILPEVGECCITGVVNVSGYMEFFVLQNTRLNLVMNMAKECVEVVKMLDNYLNRKYKTIKVNTRFVNNEAAVTIE